MKFPANRRLLLHGCSRWLCLGLVGGFGAFGVTAVQAAPMAAFNYPPIVEPILSAGFSADFAALTAHRTLFGDEVNMAMLIDVSGLGLPNEDLSDDMFGTAAFPDPPLVNMGLLETGVVSAAIDASFFPALASGSVGLHALFTDTDDGLFAIDYLALIIQTATQTIEAYYGSGNDGFGIGVPDNGDLPAPLPDSIPIGATGTGFDETIGSKSIHVVPEPVTFALLALGLATLLRRRRLN